MKERRYWTRDRVIDAMHAWHTEHGRVPSKMRDWRRATPEHPAAPTVDRVFGSWNAAVIAAGLTPNKPGTPTSETREKIAAALLDCLLATGKWPTKNTWRAAGMRPSVETIEAVCGSWNRARRLAGWTQMCRHCDRQLCGRQRLWCSSICRQRAARTEPTPRAAILGCTGCGADRDSYTLGCATCSARHSQRRSRVIKASSARRLAAVEPLTTAPVTRRDFAASTTTREAEAPAGEEEVAA